MNKKVEVESRVEGTLPKQDSLNATSNYSLYRNSAQATENETEEKYKDWRDFDTDVWLIDVG